MPYFFSIDSDSNMESWQGREIENLKAGKGLETGTASAKEASQWAQVKNSLTRV